MPRGARAGARRLQLRPLAPSWPRPPHAGALPVRTPPIAPGVRRGGAPLLRLRRSAQAAQGQEQVGAHTVQQGLAGFDVKTPHGTKPLRDRSRRVYSRCIIHVGAVVGSGRSSLWQAVGGSCAHQSCRPLGPPPPPPRAPPPSQGPVPPAAALQGAHRGAAQPLAGARRRQAEGARRAGGVPAGGLVRHVPMLLHTWLLCTDLTGAAPRFIWRGGSA